MALQALRADDPASTDAVRDLLRRFNGVRWGIANVTLGANGNANIAHGLGAVPASFFAIQAGSDTSVVIDAESAGATNIVVHGKAAADGADVTSGAHTVFWFASLDTV